MEIKFDESHALRRTLLRKINAQRAMAVSSLALLFVDEPRVETRKAAAARFQELANHIVSCDRQELWRITRALHKWRLATPLSMPSLDDLRQEVNLGDVSRT